MATPPNDQAHVIAEAARLFNQLGYTISSLDMVERELRVGLTSEDSFFGGEELARAAFDFAVEASDGVILRAVEGETTMVGQLNALIGAFRRFVENPPVEGGSPVFHAAVQSHQAFPFIEDRARSVVNGWRHQVRRIIRTGIKLGEIRPSADPEQVASIVVGTLEGAIFLHRIYDDTSHLDRSIEYLHRYLEEEVYA